MSNWLYVKIYMDLKDIYIPISKIIVEDLESKLNVKNEIKSNFYIKTRDHFIVEI